MSKKIFRALLGLLLLAQLIRPDLKNPAIDPAADLAQALNPPADVLRSLKNACYDCHSNQTTYPWYSQIAPVSWWVSQHVQEGREHLNFSEIGKLSPGDRAEALQEAAESLQEGEMPLSSYTWLGMHPKANLTTAQRDALLVWLNANGEKGASGKENDED